MPIINFSQPAYDADASTYFTTAGVTSTAGKQQISRFVTGVKDLGLWSNMVCWPLRSSQNAGTGTTAYSLGGLGTFNGTISTTPSWDADGISFSGTGTMLNNSIATSVRTANAYSSILVCSNASTGTVNFGVLKGGGSNQTGDNYIAFSRQFNFLAQSQIYLTGGDSTRGFGSLSFSSSGFQFFGSTRNGLTAPATNTGSVTLNGSTNSTLSGTGNLPSTNPFGDNFYIFGSSTAGNSYAFALVINSSISSGNMQSIRTLYKTTLGQGLGLP
jgi:hypothetical protein